MPITLAPFVCDLGVYMDCDLSMRTHVHSTHMHDVTVLRLATSNTSNPSRCTVGHSSDVIGLTGTFPTGLRQWCAGWSFGLLDAPSPVGPECGVTADQPSENLRPQ